MDIYVTRENNIPRNLKENEIFVATSFQSLIMRPFSQLAKL